MFRARSNREAGRWKNSLLHRTARNWPVLVLLVGLISPLLFSTWYTFNTQRAALERAVRLELQQITSVLASGMSEPIWNLAPELGRPLLMSLMNDQRLTEIRVTSRAEGDFLQASRETTSSLEPIALTLPVVRGGESIGKVFVRVDSSAVSAQLDEQWPTIYALGIMQGVLGLGVVAFVHRALRRREREQALREMNRRLTEEVQARANALEEAHAELLRKENLAVLGRLTATVSHELRNPLGTIDNSLSIVTRLLRPGEELARGQRATLEQALDRAHRNIERCTRLTDELLGFTRSGALHREETDIDAWLDKLMAEHTLPEGIALELHLRSGASIAIDRERMYQAITNLIGNAVQAMTEGEHATRAGVLTLSSELAGDRLEIRVRDTGAGIPPQLREQIFEPLFSTRAFGFGLGLPLVKQIVEQQHGGGVEVVAAGDGAELLIWLPLGE